MPVASFLFSSVREVIPYIEKSQLLRVKTNGQVRTLSTPSVQSLIDFGIWILSPSPYLSPPLNTHQQHAYEKKNLRTGKYDYVL